MIDQSLSSLREELSIFTRKKCLRRHSVACTTRPSFYAFQSKNKIYSRENYFIDAGSSSHERNSIEPRDFLAQNVQPLPYCAVR